MIQNERTSLLLHSITKCIITLFIEVFIKRVVDIILPPINPPCLWSDIHFWGFKQWPFFCLVVSRRKRSPSRNRKYVVVPSSPILQKPDSHLCTSTSDSEVIYLEPTDNIWFAMASQTTSWDSSDLKSPTTVNPPNLAHTEPFLIGQEEQTEPVFIDEDNENYLMPLVSETESSFSPCTYQSPLMPAENKPLEKGLLRKVKEVLADVDTKTMAMHITKVDCVV